MDWFMAARKGIDAWNLVAVGSTEKVAGENFT
jgi:hypothetical protein